MGEVEVHALRGVDLELNAGEMVVLLGASGSEQQRVAIARGLDAGMRVVRHPPNTLADGMRVAPPAGD